MAFKTPQHLDVYKRQSLASQVTIIHFENKLGAIPDFSEKVKHTPNIRLLLNSRLTAITGETQVETLEITSEETGKKTVLSDPGCGIFVLSLIHIFSLSALL